MAIYNSLIPKNSLGYSNELVLSQFALPMIIPSSGSIGNNGALTLTTALNTTYANSYMYFPVNAIFSGSVAGWYYVVMSNTTTGTIYNNIFLPSSNTIPVTQQSPLAFSTTGPGAYTQTTAVAITQMSIPMRGGILGENGSLEIWIDQGNNNSAGAKRTQVSYNSSVMHNLDTTTNLGQPHRVIIQNRGHQGRQKITRANVTSEGAVPSIATTFTTNDTSVTWTLNLSMLINVATDFVVTEGYIVKATPS